MGTHYTEGRFKGKFTGTIGDFGVYSFNGNKLITTGGGGMLVCKNSHDLNRGKYLTTQAKDDEVLFIHNEIGYNYRMTNLQAVLGIAQLENVEKFISIKEQNFKYYKMLLQNSNFSMLDFNNELRPNYWFYSLIVNKEKCGFSNLELLNYLESKNIQTRPIWYLNHLQKPYSKFQAFNIQEAIYYHKNILSIPCSSTLTLPEIDYIVALVSG